MAGSPADPATRSALARSRSKVERSSSHSASKLRLPSSVRRSGLDAAAARPRRGEGHGHQRRDRGAVTAAKAWSGLREGVLQPLHTGPGHALLRLLLIKLGSPHRDHRPRALAVSPLRSTNSSLWAERRLRPTVLFPCFGILTHFNNMPVVRRFLLFGEGPARATPCRPGP